MIWSAIKQKAWQLRGLLTISSGVAGLIIAGSLTGAYQILEWSTLDLWFRLRPQESKESRVVVVNIGESDIRELGEWPISDGKLAQLLENVLQQQPRAVGVDLYRDIPQGDIAGQKKLAELFNAHNNIIGVEKVIGERVEAPAALRESNQTAMADLVIDKDGKVRRALLFVWMPDNQIALGLATRLALTYLAQENVTTVEQDPNIILGKATLSPIDKNEGAYINADVGGYQILLNFRGEAEQFTQTSLTAVLNDRVPAEFFRDKIVLIGATASSLNDLFYTPYSNKNSDSQQMPGVYIHANITSHLLSAALDGRSMLLAFPEIGEWFWVVLWSFVGGSISLILLEIDLLQKNSFSSVKWTVVSVLIPVGALFGSSYSLFLLGYWLPVISPLLALSLSAITIAGYYNQSQKNLAFTDGLTQIANRRFFDRYLDQQWWRHKKDKSDLGLILCDVDFFKVYNDTYGHQAGDDCLKQVAKAIRESVRHSDMPARYGGEEFVVILPNTDPHGAILVAEKIRFRLQEMQIPHQNSRVSSHVTISCGIASVKTTDAASPEELIANADRALYQAKENGRDCAMIAEN